MTKINYKQKLRELYSPKPDAVQEITVPTMQFMMIDGQGIAEGPAASPEFQRAVQALYGVAYTLKMGRRKAGVDPDYTISPLEGLWWMTDASEFDMNRPADWRWTLMIFQPEFIAQKDFQAAVAELKKKKPNPALDLLRLETFDEGSAIQIMHIGPYDQERPDIQKLEQYAEQHAYLLRGKHHEIYLGDPRRSKPESLRTILRWPVSRSLH